MNRQRRTIDIVRVPGWVALMVIATVFPMASNAEVVQATCTGVIDGDTIRVEVDGQPMVVELAEIDAPELGQPYGAEARAHLAELLLDKPLEMMVRTKGHRNLGRVRVDKQEVALLMLDAGFAWTGDTEDETMILAMMRARGASLGLWQGAEPEPPLVWRSRKPPTPTPTPVSVARSLSDAGRRVALEKNEDGKTVIAGLPMIDPSERAEEKKDAPKEYESTFDCEPTGLDGCVESKFRSRFGALYEGDNPGAFSKSMTDPGNGQKNFVFQGLSTKGRSFAVGCGCLCQPEAKKCKCVIKFGKLEEQAAAGDGAAEKKAE